MIGLINRTIETNNKLTCISRPRRFGKSYAAQMLCAYYDKTCDSGRLFDGLNIAKDETYRQHLNKYDVIYLDMTNLLGKAKPEDLVEYAVFAIKKELSAAYPDMTTESPLDECLAEIVEREGNKFIMIIDEWDAPIREASHVEDKYLKFLRMLFKSSGTTPKVFAAAYMTGILPIKKDGNQSAISDFKEYTMLEPLDFAPYTGFTGDEVRKLCENNGLSFETARRWYDGYTAGESRSIYNPYSFMSAVSSGKFRSYWKKTSAAEALMTYIDMDEDGLQETITRLAAGEAVEVDTDGFQNDLNTFSTKDDVLTLLIHLGYLAYDEEYGDYWEDNNRPTGYARIPNEEIKIEFEKILRRAEHKSLIELIRKSDQLLKDTLNGNEKAVAKAFERVRDTEYAPSYYNDEQALRYVIKFAYISCVDQYAKIEEMPTGHGIADVVYVPKRRSQLPAMVIELKWNKGADKAIAQIDDRNYAEALRNYGGEIVLVGISYDEKTKKHACRIRRTSEHTQ